MSRMRPRQDSEPSNEPLQSLQSGLLLQSDVPSLGLDSWKSQNKMCRSHMKKVESSERKPLFTNQLKPQSSLAMVVQIFVDNAKRFLKVRSFARLTQAILHSLTLTHADSRIGLPSAPCRQSNWIAICTVLTVKLDFYLHHATSFVSSYPSTCRL